MATDSRPHAINMTDIANRISQGSNDLTNNEPGAREKLLKLSHQLTAALETPSDTIQRMGWTEPAGFACAQIAIDLGIFEILAQAADAPVGLYELSKQLNKDAALLSRVLKHLAAINIIDEKGADEYAGTKISTALTEPRYRDGISYTFYVAGPSFNAIPEYLKKTDYAHPGNIADGPFQYAHKTQNPFFIWLAENPERAKQFNNYMSGYRQGKRSWCDPGFYPVMDRIGTGSSPATPVLVDVGGGAGHDLEELKKKHPDLTGTLVLQDQESVVKQIENNEQLFLPTTHDFFLPQPIHGARAYYLHSVLHDWDDASCLKILNSVVSVMTAGYSKLLINEYVIPDVGAASSITSMDWLMLALGAVKERTEKQWRQLLEDAGLRVTGIWTYEQGTESLIEAENVG